MAAVTASGDAIRVDAEGLEGDSLLVKPGSAEQPPDRRCPRSASVKILISAVVLLPAVLWLTLQSPLLGFHTTITTASFNPIFDAFAQFWGSTSSYDSAVDQLLATPSKTDAPWATSSVNGVPMIIDDLRTLWTSGWDARHAENFLEAPPVISWTPEAISILRNEFNRIQFPSDCHQVKG